MPDHAPLRLVVGLGNPGAEYCDTRHNAGAWFVERLARQLGTPLAGEGRFFGLAGRHGNLRLLIPTTFMNRSGQSVAAMAQFFRIEAEEILVVHDELDLPPGEQRLKKGGGHAGHNGLKDIAARLGNPGFWRLRIGIGHPRSLDLNQNVADFVLHRPRSEEQTAIDGALDRALACWPALAGGHFGSAQQTLHANPPKEPS